MILLESAVLRDEARFEEVFSCLKGGGLLIYPTETVYGIGGALSSSKATEKIFSIKSRAKDRPLFSIAYDLRQAESFADFRYQMEYKLFELFGDKGLTVVLNSRPFVSSRVRGGASTIGIRLASTEFCRTLTELLAEPLTSTIANLSNTLVPSANECIPRKLSDVPESLMEDVDYAIDGGELPDHVPSTVIRVLDEDRIVLLREGVVSHDDIASLGVRVESAEAYR
ncbi:MAG: L-threonylcarbamoyladenylate synthase [Candidatus Kapaibacterium sp.]|jgi:L-threonylcarbamoyladenylate synthase